jgi:hypothetical protein
METLWGITAAVVPTAFGLGVALMIMPAPELQLAARLCFALSGLWLGVIGLMWLIHTPTSMGYRVLVGFAVGAFVFVVIPLLIRVAGPSVDAQVTTTPTPGGNMTTPTPPISPVNITGDDNVVSIGQIGGITARTVINQAVKPELRIVSRQGVDNPDGSHTEVI